MNIWDMFGMAAFVVEKYIPLIIHVHMYAYKWMREALESAVIFTIFTIFTIQLDSEIRAETDFVKSFFSISFQAVGSTI